MKKVFSLLFCLMLVFSLALPAFATSGTPDPTYVTYRGSRAGFEIGYDSRYSETDLFSSAFKGVMPGDTITQQVIIKNKQLPQYRVKIYMRPLGEVEHENPEFKDLELSTLNIKVTNGASTPFLYNYDGKEYVPASSGKSQNSKNDGWIDLGYFNSGASVTLNVTMKIPPELTGEEVESAVGCLQWEFKAEQTYITSDNPKTGDYIIMAVCVLAVSGVALAVIFFARKKKKK